MSVRILITGSRDWTDENAIYYAIAGIKLHLRDITIVHGGAKGADSIAGKIAETMGLEVEVYPADWEQYGKRAGFVRNAEMIDTGPQICLAFVKNNSRGASMTIALAEKAGIPTKIFRED